MHEVVRGDKHNLRKSANCKAQVSKICEWMTLICALRFADFLRLCLSPQTTSRTISFSISNSFWYYFMDQPPRKAGCLVWPVLVLVTSINFVPLGSPCPDRQQEWWRQQWHNRYRLCSATSRSYPKTPEEEPSSHQDALLASIRVRPNSSNVWPCL